ncbi:MAG: FtsW/RodA/SpoVE family cell cycle protein [Flavobacteriales bacterium]|nr:FtsW/RodA/SpoVE family cell cycle protein [Flavobacteriales bacterium]MCB9191025.1 FtsW/RodA/SpoVE family cell cycle protein [Flavobacteriales bacterium]MCB9205468.1 FtsW/RodA/SpoVE family cell cycle protein [Flavobacteriales bacterium]
MNLLLRKYLQGDMVIWAVVFLFSLVSAMAVYSSTGTLAYRYQGGNTEYYLLKHFSIIVLGWGLMYMIHKVPFKYFSRVAQILIWISIPLLAVTLIAGTSRNEASRWLTLPIINLSFQTSDLAKVALIAYLARILSLRKDDLSDFKAGFLQIVWPVIAVCVLIFPANFSTAAVLFTTSMILMFIGGVKLKYLSGLVAAAITGAAFILLLSYVLPLENVGLGRVETWKKRLETFVSNEETQKMADANYQTEQAKIAIAKGGPFGVGPGNSSQRNFIPHPYSDFIFAIILEEWGLVGGMGILFLYLILLFRGLRIVHKGTSTFGTLLAFGVCFALVFQAFINMAVAVNLFPVTGQPLPLISMGGTSIWFTSIAIGMILSVSRDIKEDAQSSHEPQPELAHV